MSKNLSTAAEAVRKASDALRHPERSNSDIVPLRNEEQEGYGIYQLALGMREKLFGAGKSSQGNDYNRALTVVAIANRVTPVEARTLFLWLYGDRDGSKLRDLATTMYHRIIWPTDAGTVEPRVGINICISILLRHFWFRNGYDYDKHQRPLSPTVMSKMLGLPIHKSRGPVAFHDFQRKQPFDLLSLWELQADNQISGEMAEKGFV